jgi:hypothetical protein
VRVAAQPFGCLVLLDEGPYRLERGGVRDEFMLPPLGLKRSKVDGRMRCRTGQGDGDECAKISQRQPFLFLSFRGHSVPPLDHSHVRLAHQKRAEVE